MAATPTDRRPLRTLGLVAAAIALAATGACSGGDASPARDAPTVQAPGPQDDLASTSETSGLPATTCTTASREPAPTSDTWNHPSQSYYTGTEDDLPSAQDLEHLMRADGAAVLRYRSDVQPSASMDALRTWAENGEAIVALPATDDAAAAVSVDVLDRTLSCDGLDTVQLDAFVAERDTSGLEAH